MSVKNQSLDDTKEFPFTITRKKKKDDRDVDKKPKEEKGAKQ